MSRMGIAVKPSARSLAACPKICYTAIDEDWPAPMPECLAAHLAVYEGTGANMSNIVDIIQSAQGGQIIENLSDRFGLASWQTRAAVDSLLPALVAALSKAAEQPDSLRPLLDAANDAAHRAAFENAEEAHSQASLDGGDAIVAHLFGSAAAAGEVSQLAARESGLRADVLQRLLPVLVSIAAGGLGSTLERQGVAAVLDQPTEPPAPAPKGGWLAGLFASLFGTKPAPQPRTAPPADALQEALDHIRKTLTAPADAERRPDLDELLGRIFTSARG
ncbi:DUF937 domain-containing protein [Methylosinus sporium]|uniref:DUF937 domain-containing protein n=2 Tax=Methylocystaceae TaxID=31993 RepID=A0A549SS80_METSR|nr:DUF937 domain-containing protein [Methylosinus sporium]